MSILSSAYNKVKSAVKKVGNVLTGNASSAVTRAVTSTAKPKGPVLNAPLLPGLGINNKGQVVKKGGSSNSQTGLALSPGQFGGAVNAGSKTGATSKFIGPIQTRSGSNAGGGGSVYPAGANIDTSNSSAGFQSSPTIGVNNVNTNTGTPGTSVVNTPTTYLGDKNAYDSMSAFQPTDAQQVQQEADKSFQDMLDAVNANQPQSREDIYSKLEKDLQIAQKEQEAKLVEDKIKAINAKAEANQLSLIGQGRGIPEAIIGGQQAQISKEAAIAVLPLSAEYAAKKGNLDLAKESLDKLYQIKVADIDAKTAHQNKVIELIYNYADKKTQAKLDAIKLQNQYQREDLKDLVKQQNDYISLAFENNQYSLASKIRLLDHNSKTFLKDLNALASQVRNKAPASSGSTKLRYSVELGDEPQIIANKLGMNMYTLMALNEGVDWYNLQPGQKLNTGQSEFAVPKVVEEPGTISGTDYNKGLNYILSSGLGQDSVDLFKSNRAYQAQILSEMK